MTKLSDYVITAVADSGVGHVFLLPGGGCMHLVDSIGRSQRLQHICCLHEQACAIAAEAYAQYTNRLGVALVTTGPGGTNALTGVAAAWVDSTPCLFLSGQVKRQDMIGARRLRQFGFQEVDIVRIVAPITKYAATVLDPGTIRFHLEKAFFLARSGRPGPVWLDIPLDVQAAEVDGASLRGFTPPPDLGDSGSTVQERARHAASLLLGSERPVVLVGNGVRLARAESELETFVNRWGVPVLTTWKAIDLLADDHPLFFGRPGAVGQRAANFIQQNADVLLTVGARLDLGQTGYSHAGFAPWARKIVVDIDPAEIDKLDTPIEVPIVADAGEFLRAMGRTPAPSEALRWQAWVDRCAEWKRRYPVVLPEHWQVSEGVNLYVLVETLARQMTGADLLVPGSSGACSEVTMQAFRVKAGQRVLNSQGLGPMGFGIAAALGACVASGSRRTICIDGDGGFHMNTQELETLRRLQLPVKIFVLNNGGYESIRVTQRAHFGGRLVASSRDTGLTLPDTRKVAEAFGIASFEIRGQTDLESEVRRVLELEGPVVCDVLVSPEQVTSPRIVSRVGPDGRIVSTPLEDMWPFLDREELRRNMLALTGSREE